MGVSGFTRFVDENNRILRDHKLHDCRLIIDGHNLFHFLYYYFRINCEYGGDYDIYAKAVRYYFKTLKSCNIQAYVVFDGTHEKDDRKLETTLKRAKDKISIAGELSHGGRGKVIPLLAGDTFIHVLDSLGVPHVTCDGEADAEIAALANHWNCPVLSNDSDFFVFNLTAGMILMDYLNLNVRTEEEGNGKSYKYLNVQLYHTENFLKIFPAKMDYMMLPFFASIAGNDYVDPSTIETFYATVKLPKASTCSYIYNKRHPKIVSLLLWLESMEKLSVAKERFFKQIKKDKREKVNELIEKSMSFYLNLNSYLHHWFETYDTCKQEPQSHTELTSYNGKPLPGWFVTNLKAGKISWLSIGTLILHRFIFSCQIECLNEPSSYTCALPLRRLMYGILLSFDSSASSRCSPSPRRDGVEEYDRVGKDLKKTCISPLFQSPDGATLPDLSSVPNLTSDERKAILLDCLEIKSTDSMENIPIEFRLLLFSIVYWVKKSNPKINNLQVLSVLLSVFKLNLVEILHHMVKIRPNARKECKEGSQDVDWDSVDPNDFFGDSTDDQDNYTATDDTNLLQRLSAKCETEPIEHAWKGLNQFMKQPIQNNAHRFDAPIVHNLAQLQACLHVTYAINKLLLCPLPLVVPARVLNGSFIYNVYKELHRRKRPELYIDELLHSKSPVAELFKTLYTFICSALSDSDLVQVQPIQSKSVKSKKSKGSKRKETDTFEEQSPDEMQVDTVTDQHVQDLGDQKIKLKAKCKLTNKFGCLDMED